MKTILMQLSCAALMTSCISPTVAAMTFKGNCMLNQTSPDHSLSGSDILNAMARVEMSDDKFTATYVDSKGKESSLSSPALNIRLEDGVMALYGYQWMAMNNNTFYVISSSRRIVIDNCTPRS